MILASFGPADIRNRYSLLGAFLLVVEGLLGYWLYIASDVTERYVIGGIMTGVFVSFLVAVCLIVKMGSTRIVASRKEMPIRKRATEKEISDPPADTFIGPDGSYLINKPPHGWSSRMMDYKQWFGETNQISDPRALDLVMQRMPLPAMIMNDMDADRILVIQAERKKSLVPIPGKTRISSRSFPCALEITSRNRLSIIPMDRMVAPFYIERSMIQNFCHVLGGILNAGAPLLSDLKLGTVSGGKYKHITARLKQRIENVYVEGKVEDEICNNIIAIGIEGDICDYVLIMSYSSRNGVDENREEVKTLYRLASSFRPLELADQESRRKRLKEQADQEFNEQMEVLGGQMFYQEFSVGLYRIADADLEKLEDRVRVIKTLKPFKELAGQIGVFEEELEDLWLSLEEAERGNSGKLKIVIEKFREAIIPEESSLGANLNHCMQ